MALCVFSGLLLGGCGQKGPPLAPIVVLPRPVGELTAKRVEGEVVLRFTVPNGNADGSTPADLRRIEVYAHTGALPPNADFTRYGTLISSIPVKDPSDAEQKGPSDAEQQKSGALDAKAGVAKAGDAMVEQGATAVVRETLTPKHYEPGPMPPAPRAPSAAADAAPVETVETPGTVNFEMLTARYYAVVPVSRSRGRRGRFAGPIGVPLAEPQAPPQQVELSYTADAISLKWPGLPEDVTPPAVAVVLPSADPPVRLETEGTVDIYSDVETEGTENPPSRPVAAAPPKVPPPAPRFGYNVYEASPTVSPVPLNTALLTVPAFNDPRVEFGSERCYVVRRVEMVRAVPIESAPSAAACVVPVDTFPPQPPRTLQSIAAGTSVSLLWEANTESDLGGYLVLRGEAPGDKLAPLMAAPISDTSYVDNTVQRGRTYVYEVIAVDKSTPPNQSAPSNRVEESIR